MAEAVLLNFKHGAKDAVALLSHDGSLGLGSLAAFLGLEPLGVTVGPFALNYNPSTGQSPGFDTVLRHVRQAMGDEQLGSNKERSIVLQGRAAGATGAAAGEVGVGYAADVAADMVRPLEGMTIPALSDLKDVLDDHRGLHIPVTQPMYAYIAQHTDAVTLQKLKVVKDNILSERLGSLITRSIVELHSEETTTCTVKPFLSEIRNLLSQFSPLKLSSFEFFGNRTESNTSSSFVKKRSRPDLLGIMDAATLYVAEHKARAKLTDAVTDLEQYVKAGLLTTHYGNVRYILGHVAAAAEFRFTYVTADGQVGSASSAFLLDSIDGCLSCMLSTLRVFKLISLLRSGLPDLGRRTQPMFKWQERGLTSIRLTGTGASKVIKQFDDFCNNHHVTEAGIKAGYEAAGTAAVQMQQQQRQPFLIHALSGPKCESRRSGSCYSVSTTPLGYSSTPKDEQELLSLAWACCKAAAVLHANNLVHRDFHMPNVVRLSKEDWLVIDLELCSNAPVVLPDDYTQTDWTTTTLEHVDGTGQYTGLSDMRQIGAMLHAVRPRQPSPEAVNFINQLSAKSLSAEAALQHPWLQTFH